MRIATATEASQSISRRSASAATHQAKDESHRGVDLPHFLVGEATRDIPQSLGIHGGCLFGKHSREWAAHFHFGAKLAASADVDVGATSRWITSENQIARRLQTGARTSRCLCFPSGPRKRNTSPRTQCLQVTENLRRLGAILLVRGKCGRLGTQLFLAADTGGIDQC